MADKAQIPTPAYHPPAPAPAPAMSEKGSGFHKVIAFLDLLVKLAATGALFGILVLLLGINSRLRDIAGGEEPVLVRISQLSSSNPVPISVYQDPTAGPMGIAIKSGDGSSLPGSIGNPYYIKVDE